MCRVVYSGGGWFIVPVYPGPACELFVTQDFGGGGRLQRPPPQRRRHETSVSRSRMPHLPSGKVEFHPPFGKAESRDQWEGFGKPKIVYI